MDVLCINRYYGWYQDIGQLQTISYKLTSELMEWYQRYQRPVVITEYGADTVAGLHAVRALYATTDHTRSDGASPVCTV